LWVSRQGSGQASCWNIEERKGWESCSPGLRAALPHTQHQESFLGSSSSSSLVERVARIEDRRSQQPACSLSTGLGGLSRRPDNTSRGRTIPHSPLEQSAGRPCRPPQAPTYTGGSSSRICHRWKRSIKLGDFHG